MNLVALIPLLVTVTILMIGNVNINAKLDHKTFQKCFKNPDVLNQDVANALDEKTKTMLIEKAVEYNATIPNADTHPIESSVYGLVTKIHVCLVEQGN